FAVVPIAKYGVRRAGFMDRMLSKAAAAFLILMPFPVGAVETSPTARSLLRVTLDYDELATPAGRKSLAVAARDYCAEIERDYPKTSPAEEQWLMSEINGAGDRVMRALASAEMGRRMAARFTED